MPSRKPSSFSSAKVKEPTPMFKTLCTSRKSATLCLLFGCVLAATFVLRTPSASAQPAQRDGQSRLSEVVGTESLKALQYRSIGPYRGGRSAAVAGVPSQPMVYYFGATGGGVWKTTDGGANWEPITDGSVFGTGSVGAIGLSDSDP